MGSGVVTIKRSLLKKAGLPKVIRKYQQMQKMLNKGLHKDLQEWNKLRCSLALMMKTGAKGRGENASTLTMQDGLWKKQIRVCWIGLANIT
ncbi:hypothetical protein HanIR_Chr15g0734341 [Helianthus annuus]|nr:hypothetical protein HanIR_Chr15g0734341 [Helianthus annuus]